ncbi:MAG: HU family DNA-binding protein [Phycisphaerales bacterium]|nr:HU family DNA-binding protein [Phycisphaerales bacterium]
MATITKKDLIDRIAERTKQKRTSVKRTIQQFLDEVTIELGQGNRLEFRDFGVFEIRERAPRVAQNPKTLAPVTVPAKKTIKFKMGRKMREALDAAEAGRPMVEVRARLMDREMSERD